MADRVLPSRERLNRMHISTIPLSACWPIVEAYRSGELQTEAERREAIDYKKVIRALDGYNFEAREASPAAVDQIMVDIFGGINDTT